MKLSNPRLHAVIENWPYGKLRTTATFTIETTNKGQRARRTTIDPKTGRENNPKITTFAKQARIVDGDDGRTYIMELGFYGNISIMQSNLQFQERVVYDSAPEYGELRALFNA